MNCKLFSAFFLLAVLSVLSISASTIGISPPLIKISGTENQIACENFTLFGEENSLFTGEIKWSEENSKNINQYILPSERLKINANFPGKVGKGKYQICLSAKNSGDYFGALTYKMINSSYAIGTWIQLSVKKDNSIQEVLSITGDTIKKIDYKKIFLFTPILFVSILILLLLKLKRKARPNN
jgi:hypothetical protein